MAGVYTFLPTIIVTFSICN